VHHYRAPLFFFNAKNALFCPKSCYFLAYINKKQYFCSVFFWKNGQNKHKTRWKNGQHTHIFYCINGQLTNAEYYIRRAIVLSNGNVSVKGNVLYASVYMTMFLHYRKQEGSIIYHPDLP
jgi:hypothetical protein